MLGRILPAIVAVSALALLAFLVSQSRPVSVVEHAGQARTLDLIRQSAEDVRTLGHVLGAARRELRIPGVASDSISDRLRDLRAGVEQQIIARGFDDSDTAISESLGQYTTSMERVQQSVSDFVAHQTEFAISVTEVRDHSGSVIQRLRSRGDDAIAQGLFSLVSQTLDYARSTRGVTTATLTSRLEAIGKDTAFQASQSTAVSDLLRHVETIITHRDPADEALLAMGAEPFLEAAGRLAGASEAAYRVRIDRVERSRLLLVAYCGLLLLGVGFVLYRLNLSYRRINEANAELAAANENLESRVRERTSELEGAYHNLKESQVQLVQAEKMSSLGQLVAGISHEINTPLLYLQSNSSLVRERLDLLQAFVDRAGTILSMRPQSHESASQFSGRFLKALRQLKRVHVKEELTEVVAEAVELMRDSEEGLADLTEMARSLKDFSRLDRAPMGHFDVNEGLEKTLLIARNALKHKAEIVREFGELPSVFCSPSQINQVFLNLVTNAAQAIDGQGTITITTRCNGDDQVAVAIRDSGSGIPEDIIESIRDPFFTTKEVGEGTGLGLSIVDRIVREHGGQLHIDSRVGEGATFTVVLPVDGRRPESIDDVTSDAAGDEELTEVAGLSPAKVAI